MLPRVNLVRGDQIDYLLFSTQDAVSSTIYFTGGWASPLLTISRLFYQDVAQPLILDIGANLGAYSIPVARDVQAAGGMVYAFEPQRIIYYQLCGNAFLNRLDNIYLFCKALGAAQGWLNLPAVDYAQSINIGGFSIDERIRERTQAVSTLAGRSEPPVELTTLDALDLPRSPSLIKIDVEGLELQVLRGGSQFLARHSYPPMLLEAWRSNDWFAQEREALLAYIQELGYEIFEISDEVIAQHPAHPRQISLQVTQDGTIQMARRR